MQKMRKLATVIAAFLLSSASLHAQDDTNMFNHMAFGITAGTPGVGLELAMPIGEYVQVRAGATYMPKLTFGSELDYNYDGVDPLHGNKMKVKSTTDFFNGKILFDLYPAPSFPLHLTVGAYIGGEKPFSIKNDGYEEKLKDVYYYNSSGGRNNDPYNPAVQSGEKHLEGPLLGDYVLLPDNNGVIDAYIKTSLFKPYVGLGWGKAVSDKGFDWMLEGGVMFWNKPKVYCTTYTNGDMVEYELPALGEKAKSGGLIKVMSGIAVYPVINFRIGFNMF